MASLFCWKTGMLGICPTKQLPDGTVEVWSGVEGVLRSLMLTTARHDTAINAWYIPGVQELGDGEDKETEDEKFKLVQAYEVILYRKTQK